MCGISAILSDNCDVGALLRMHQPIQHRGPDGEGFLGITSDFRSIRARQPGEFEHLCSGQRLIAAIGFRRLNIQDLSLAADQPMTTTGARIWIALNGEIYNFRALRDVLAARGHQFTSHSDTEVALAAYAEWRTDCFRHFNGMWAIVIIDLDERRIVVARDRVGIKPLFISSDGQAVLLSSEARQIIAARKGRPRADVDSVARFVAGEWLQLEHTFFDGIQAFPAATSAIMTLGGRPILQPRRYWDLTGSESLNGSTFRDAAQEAEALLLSAIDLQLVAEVGVGTLLSGGLDSTLLTAMAKEVAGRPLPAFGFVLDETVDRGMDESRYIKQAAQQAGLPLQLTSMHAAWVRNNLLRVTRAQESPLTGAPVMAQFRTHELAAASGVRVVLDGQGSDEVFGGYKRHQAILLNDLLLRGSLFSFAREMKAFSRRDMGFPIQYIRQGLLSPVWRAVRPNRRMPRWFRGMRQQNDIQGSSFRDRSLLNRILYRDVTVQNLPAVLGITDRNSMAHSLEARVPFLDHRMIEFAFRLPPSFKIGDGSRKRILREIAKPYISSEVISRTDSLGFGTPQKRWMTSDLCRDVQAAAHDSIFAQNTLIDSKALTRDVDQFVHADGAGDATRMWTVWALHAWYQAFDVLPE